MKKSRKKVERLTYRPEEAAELADLGINQFYNAVNCGLFPSIRVGRRILIPKVAFHRLLSEGKPSA